MGLYKVGILSNEEPESVKKWKRACEKFQVEYDVISSIDANWLEKVKSNKYHFFLLRPPGNFEKYKKIYDEKVYILSKVLGYRTFPSYEECYVYENKKLLVDYLAANNIPHPKSFVSYDKHQAMTFVEQTDYPIVAKTSVGASGSGVRVIRTKEQAKKYVRKAFSKSGIKRSFGPNRVIGSYKKWFSKALSSPSYFLEKIKQYYTVYSNPESGYVIFQQYIPHDYEWRAVKIGDSYFAHKKIKYKDKASGSKGIDYVTPQESLLNFIKKLCDDQGFQFMAIDLFEDNHGNFLVNELQTIFGHVQDYILSVNNISGRYLYHENKWLFEPGDFNSNESYDLRLETAFKIMEGNLR